MPAESGATPPKVDVASDDRIALGFMPGIPLYEIYGQKVTFGIEDLQRALFDSTYREPIVLPLVISEITGGSDIKDAFPLVVASVQQFYPPHEHDHNDRPVGCWNEPDWLVRGHLAKHPHDPYPEFMWIIALVITDGADRTAIDRIEVQLIRDRIDGPRPW